MFRMPLLIVLSFLAVASPAPADDQSKSLPRSTPEAEGISSEAILEFVEAADQQIDSMHSFMIVRHGRVVAEGWWEPESADKPHVMWSLSKSFTSTAVGLAVEEGKLSIDDHVVSFFPHHVPAEPTEHLRKMRVRDLLTMSAGHEQQVRLDDQSPWVRQFLHHEVPHQPGTHFKYNTPATYMLSAIVQKVTGESVLDYLTPRLFQPLGIQTPRWDTCPEGITLGGYGLFLRTEDIAKFGQLCLQRGMWNGKQLVPETWIAEATGKQISNGSNENSDWNQGYGFQFWRCRNNAFRGDGKDGQFCVVIPEHDVVVAMTAQTRDLQGELQLIWDKLLPGFHNSPLNPNVAQHGTLLKRIELLQAGN